MTDASAIATELQPVSWTRPRQFQASCAPHSPALTASGWLHMLQVVCNMRDLASDARTIADTLARQGVRLTAPRRAVVDVLVQHTAPLSVAEIHARLDNRRINLVSVYRTVRLLLEQGLVRLADESKGTQRFELAEAFTGHHHHLVCRECGHVEDLEGCWLGQEMLDALHRRVQRLRRFRVTAHDLKLFGLCQQCNGA
jgi:Fur family transcriptional regulator, ferric uptake regulator